MSKCYRKKKKIKKDISNSLTLKKWLLLPINPRTVIRPFKNNSVKDNSFLSRKHFPVTPRVDVPGSSPEGEHAAPRETIANPVLSYHA